MTDDWKLLHDEVVSRFEADGWRVAEPAVGPGVMILEFVRVLCDDFSASATISAGYQGGRAWEGDLDDPRLRLAVYLERRRVGVIPPRTIDDYRAAVDDAALGRKSPLVALG